MKKLFEYIDDKGCVVEFSLLDTNCPNCGKLESAAIVVADSFVAWCSCGCIFRWESQEFDLEVISYP